jgi:predicted Zn-dependent protease with MMP-like domain
MVVSMTSLATSPNVEQLVAAELDALPDWLLDALESVPVVVCDGGEQAHAYGLYQGDGAARDDRVDRIVIFRDTLLRDFGDDPARLRAEVRDTVRHEIAHHLGWDEGGVRALGF